MYKLVSQFFSATTGSITSTELCLHFDNTSSEDVAFVTATEIFSAILVL